MKKIILLSLATCSYIMAGGYKIPEVSTNAVALSSANVAHTKSADASYYNPANMVFMKDEHSMELGLTYIGLSEVDYKGDHTSKILTSLAPTYADVVTSYETNSKSENFLIPTFFYVSPDIDGARFGFAMVVPAGLSKRWDEQPAKGKAEEFTLTTIELNPTVALPIGDKIGIALGIRAIYTEGIVKSDTGTGTSRDMDGDSLDFGYNIAVAYHPTKELELAVTYRSNIDLSVEGDASLSFNDLGNAFGGGAGTIYTSNSSASVEIPVPAALNLAIAYTFSTKTTVEFVYERTYWSEYSELDFNYGSGVSAVTNAIFGASIAKDYDDVSAFRFGITQELDDLTLMAGFVIDESPIPESTLEYSLPDSDSTSVSLGARYQVNEKISVGLSALYSMRDDRTVVNDTLNGEFTDSTVLIVSTGLEYKF